MIFSNATIITMNPSRDIITNAAIAVEGCRIAAIGKTRDILEKYPDHEVIDCNGNILMPGLIDTHVHTAQAMIRGCADDLRLIDWLFKRVWVLQGNYSNEDGKASAALCTLEHIKSGTTSFLECMLAERYGIDGVVETLIESGIRASVGKIVMDRPSYAESELQMYPGMVEDAETGIGNTLKAYDKWNGAGNGRIEIWFGPRTPGGVTPSIYDEIGRLAAERNMGITIHLSEIKEDNDYAKSQGFRSAAEFALAHGLLGKKTVLAHFVWSDEADWKILADTGTTVSHNPASNAKTATGIARVQKMIDAGVNVGLGTDGGPSNNTYDMIRDMRLASYLGCLIDNDPTSVTAETVLEMATINGAKAIGREHEIGSLEVGKKADFIMFDMDKPHLVPCWDPVSTIVYSAHGSDVDTVVCDGKILMRGRKVLTLDEESVLSEANRRYREVAERAGIRPGSRIWPVL